jgi:hypothetical protein
MYFHPFSCFLLFILFFVSVKDSKHEHRSNCVDLFREAIDYNIPADFPQHEPFQVTLKGYVLKFFFYL